MGSFWAGLRPLDYHRLYMNDPMCGVGAAALQQAATEQQSYIDYQRQQTIAENALFGPFGATSHGDYARPDTSGPRKSEDIPDWVPPTPAQWWFLAVVVAYGALAWACFHFGL